ncbi:MAG: thioesterase family protein [Chloroflexi bacterium]|nr:thioesterase family protein [Chloroflexota bacterium]
MPLIHEQTFPVRYDDCDPYGHVNHVAYLRLMQEVAFAASAAAGYDFARYQQSGRTWLIRETDIEYLQPLHYGDSVTIKTWVVDFRRVRSRRAYEFYRAGTTDCVARASTEWVFLDAQTLRPATIPPEMMLAFFPEGAPEPATRRPRMAELPPPPPHVFVQVRRVEWRDLDMVGHVNNANYMAYLEDCAIQVAAACGWPLSRMSEKGFAIIARRYQIEYHQSAYLGDDLAVSTWFASHRPASASRYYTITRPADGALIVRAQARWAWVARETGRPQRIPSDFLADFASNRIEQERQETED